MLKSLPSAHRCLVFSPMLPYFPMRRMQVCLAVPSGQGQGEPSPSAACSPWCPHYGVSPSFGCEYSSVSAVIRVRLYYVGMWDGSLWVWLCAQICFSLSQSPSSLGSQQQSQQLYMPHLLVSLLWPLSAPASASCPPAFDNTQPESVSSFSSKRETESHTMHLIRSPAHLPAPLRSKHGQHKVGKGR